jgi:hypothetical protein
MANLYLCAKRKLEPIFAAKENGALAIAYQKKE